MWLFQAPGKWKTTDQSVGAVGRAPRKGSSELSGCSPAPGTAQATLQALCKRSLKECANRTVTPARRTQLGEAETGPNTTEASRGFWESHLRGLEEVVGQVGPAVPGALPGP